MRNALDSFAGSIKVGGRTISNLRYADDMVLIGSGMGELQGLLNRVKELCLQFGLALNSSKIKVMKTVKNNKNTKDADHIIVDSYEIIENVKEFVYLRTLVTDNYNDTERNLSKVMHSKKCNGLINKHMERQKYYYYYKEKAAAHINQLHSQLLLRMWNIENIDKKKIEAFELWCYRSWAEKKTNE